MRLTATALYIAACAGLTGTAAWTMGWVTCVAMLCAVAVHELGHYAFLRLAGIPARVFVSPFIGFTWPVSTRPSDVERLGIPLWCEDDDSALPFTTFGHGLLLLSGTGLSLVVAGTMWLSGLIHSEWPEPLGELVFIFWFVMLVMNCLNLVVLLPLTDGGKLVLSITASSRRAWVWLVAVAGLASGAILFWRLAPLHCCLITGVSIWLLSTIVDSACEEGNQLSWVERIVLTAIWSGIVAASAALLATDDLARMIVADILN